MQILGQLRLAILYGFQDCFRSPGLKQYQPNKNVQNEALGLEVMGSPQWATGTSLSSLKRATTFSVLQQV